MRVLYPGGFAAGDDSSALRARGLAAALRVAGVELLGPGAVWPRESTGVLNELRRKYVRDGALASLLRQSRPDAVIVYPGLGAMNAVVPVAAEQGIPVIADIADWYDWHHVPRKSTPQWVLNEIAVRRSGPRAQGCITVSEYLAGNFADRGAATVVVPAVFERTPATESAWVADSLCHLAYVGEVAPKDRLAVRHLIQVAAQVDPLGEHIKVHIVGGNLDAIRSVMPRGAAIPESVVIHGRLSRQQALDTLASCNFSVVQRDPWPRYAKAGFPSKVAESLLVGTPVLANLSSDLAEHLTDGENAIVLAGDGLADMRAGVMRARHEGVCSSREQIASQARERYLAAAVAPRLVPFLQSLVRP